MGKESYQASQLFGSEWTLIIGALNYLRVKEMSNRILPQSGPSLSNGYFLIWNLQLLESCLGNREFLTLSPSPIERELL